MNLKEFENWAKTQKSVDVPGGSTNSKLKGECVSLVQQYLYKCFNVPFKARGHAKDWANTSVPGFKKGKGLKDGSILIRTSGTYGHIGIYLAKGKVLAQNNNGNRIIQVTSSMPGGYDVILNPDKTMVYEEEKTVAFEKPRNMLCPDKKIRYFDKKQGSIAMSGDYKIELSKLKPIYVKLDKPRVMVGADGKKRYFNMKTINASGKTDLVQATDGYRCKYSECKK